MNQQSTHRADFGKSMLLLAVSLGFELDEPMVGVYWHALRAIAPEIRREALTLASQQPWRRFPQPGDLRALASGVMKAKREAAARLHLEGCTHAGHWIEDEQGARRCGCWVQAMAAMEAVGQAIALPERTEDEP